MSLKEMGFYLKIMDCFYSIRYSGIPFTSTQHSFQSSFQGAAFTLELQYVFIDLNSNQKFTQPHRFFLLWSTCTTCNMPPEATTRGQRNQNTTTIFRYYYGKISVHVMALRISLSILRTAVYKLYIICKIS